MKKFLVLDVETDSLYGDVFAIGATLWTFNGDTSSGTYEIVFEGKAETEKVRSKFVIDNIIPACSDLTEYATRIELLEAFWKVYMSHKDDAHIVADFAVPCEAKLFRECIMLDQDNREFSGPYPLFDLGTLLYAYNQDPDISRKIASKCYNLNSHNPVHDTIMAGEILMKLVSHRETFIKNRIFKYV